MSFLPILVNLTWGFGCLVMYLILSLVNKHVGSQVSWCPVGLGTKWAFECAFRILALLCVLFSWLLDFLLCGLGGLLAELLS